MKLSEYARQQGISYRTAFRWWKAGTIKGYQVAFLVKEIASGVNDQRPKLLALLRDTSITRIVVEHGDRLTRFGFHYLETLLEAQKRSIEVVNVAENGTEDLIVDLTSIIYSFTAHLYGQCRAKRKTETIVKELQAKDEEESCNWLSNIV